MGQQEINKMKIRLYQYLGMVGQFPQQGPNRPAIIHSCPEVYEGQVKVKGQEGKKGEKLKG